MSLTHVTAIRNSLCNLVVDAVDSNGTASQFGDLVILDGTSTLVTIGLSPTAFGAAATGTATMNGSPSGTATTGGTADIFLLQDKADGEVFRGTVSTSGADLNLSSTTIASSDKVQITSFTYSASA